MTPAQARAAMKEQRTDARQLYALVGSDLAKHVAQAAIARFDRTELVALARSTETPVMPPEVEASITNALKEIRDVH